MADGATVFPKAMIDGYELQRNADTLIDALYEVRAHPDIRGRSRMALKVMVARLLATARAGLADGECEWTPDQFGTYDTACGNRWDFSDGGIAENKARFCIYCGKSLIDKGTTPAHGGQNR